MCLKNIPNEFKLKKTFTVNSKFNWDTIVSVPATPAGLSVC
jgi:hypothetical protein